MADDLVINVKQIAQYPQVTATAPTDRYVLQQSGVGGPYLSIAPTDLVGTALQLGGYLKLDPNAGGIAFNGALFGFNATTQAFDFSEPVHVPTLNSDGDIFVAGEALATQVNVTALIDAVIEDVVLSFNGRQGIVQLNEADILQAGGILQNNPRFSGVVIVPTPWDFRNDTEQAANCRFVQGVIEALLCSGSVVTSFNGRGGAITLTADDITLAATAPGAMPRAVTPPLYDASTRIATTLFVDESLDAFQDWVMREINIAITPNLAPYAPLASPAFTGVPTAPTANPGTTTGQLATTAFVQNAVAAATAGVSSFNTRTGAVTLIAGDITAAGGAPINSPNFTGVPLAVTAATATSTQQLATTAFVHAVAATIAAGVTSFNTRTGAVTLQTSDITGAGGAATASPAFSGTPTAPTALAGTNTTQLATCAFVLAAVTAGTAGVTSFNGRTGAVTLAANDVSAAGGALLASPSFTGVPLAPTAAVGTNTGQIATTAFVLANSVAGGVTSFNGRQGAITLTTADVTGAGGAPTASPAFSGVPTAPTAAQTVADQTIATCAYVKAAITAAGGVASFNTRTGVVTLQAADISGAGGALLAGPAFSGSPTAPTAAPGTSTTQLANTAFVAAAIGAAVTSFMGRTGAITLIGNDITAAGGALLASPTFSGTPTAPTPATGTNNTQVATTAFVQAQIAAMPPAATYKQSDTAPTAPIPQFWFDSIHGQLFVNYVDPVSSAQSWVAANTVPSPATQYSVKRTVITATGPYVPTVGMTYCDIEALGGGGGGGGAGAGGAGGSQYGAGGGAGGYSKRLCTAAQIGASQTVTIGPGGAGGPGSGATNGVAGTATSVGSLVVANGGQGGGFTGASAPGTPGAGGTPGTGDIAVAGLAGVGSSTGGGTGTTYSIPGQSGATLYGTPGAPQPWVAGSFTGAAGTGYGAGGIGGQTQGTSTAAAGAAGRPGVVVITEYIWT